jgi:lysophospholipase L1-like esterase
MPEKRVFFLCAGSDCQNRLDNRRAHYCHSELYLLPSYHFVSLLIGVNNQFRGRQVEEYKIEFENLLKQALQLCGSHKERLFVLSIPDYSMTPFAKSMDTEKIAKDIYLFNSVNKALSVQYKVNYIDIAEEIKGAEKDASLLTADGLHYSEKVYEMWAKKISELILSSVKKASNKA